MGRKDGQRSRLRAVVADKDVTIQATISAEDL